MGLTHPFSLTRIDKWDSLFDYEGRSHEDLARLVFHSVATFWTTKSRSSHRRTMLDPSWKAQGIGMAIPNDYEES